MNVNHTNGLKAKMVMSQKGQFQVECLQMGRPYILEEHLMLVRLLLERYC